MNVNLYYFSGTGNSLFIAKTIRETILNEHSEAKNTSDVADITVNILPIQKFIHIAAINDQSDIIGIIYPTYFLDIPNVVKQFAKKLRIGTSSYLFFYANYGETLGNALYNMNQYFDLNQVGGNYEVALPDNSIIFETKKEKIAKMLEDGEHKIRIHAKEIYSKKITPKSSRSMIGLVEGSAMKPLAQIGLGFNRMKVNKAQCNGCHFCEKLCPMKNIHFRETNNTEHFPVFENGCESCFSCLHFCPQGAITYKRMSKRKKDFQYSHPGISVKEMIDAQML